jgi:hypothetical protein
MNYIYSNGELYHHGVKGMKWGIRRYQNKDGSLTPLGRKRYGTFDGLANSDYGRKMAKKGKLITPSNSQSTAPKKASEMSDEELRSKIQSLQLQKTYNQLYSELNPQTVSKGKKFAKFAWDNAGKPLLNAGVKKLSDEILGKTSSEVAKKEFEKLKREAEIWEAKGKISKNKRTVDENNQYFNDKSKDQKAQEPKSKEQKAQEPKSKEQKAQEKAADKKNQSYSGTVEGEGTSKSKFTEKHNKKWYEEKSDYVNVDYWDDIPVSNVQNSESYSRGIDTVAGYLTTRLDDILDD